MSLADNIRALQSFHNSRKKRWTFTLEPGRGETYAHGKPTLYAHSTYDRSSVLAGRPQRVWVEQWDDWEAAITDCELTKKTVKGFRYERIGGTTHIPTNILVNHLPDESGY